MKVYNIILLMLVFIMFSCESTRGIQSDSVFIMIYDYNNSPVSNVGIIVDGDRIGKSDVNGRFVFEVSDRKEHYVRLEKTDYEVISDSFIYEDSLLLYYKMGNSSQYLNMAENCIDKRSYNEALKKVTKSLQINTTREDSLFLKAIIYNLLGEYEKSNIILGELENTVKFKYIEELRKKNVHEKKNKN